MARNDVVNSDGSINYNTIGGFKDRLDGHDSSLAQKAQQYVIDVKKDYSAKGDGTSDDLNAINQAITAATNLKGTNKIPTLYFPLSNGYASSGQILIPAGINVIMETPLIYLGTTFQPFLVIGSASAVNVKVKLKLQVIRNTQSDWSSESDIGIQLYNCNGLTDVDIVSASNFTIPVQLIGSGNGFSYNTIKVGLLENGKISLDCTNENNGWFNENLILGGRYTCYNAVNTNKNRYGIRVTSKDAVYKTNNNNNFLKPSFELNVAGAGTGEAIPILAEYSLQNSFKECRNENNSATFARISNTSADNHFTLGYGSIVIQETGTAPTSRYETRSKGLMNIGTLIFDSGYLPSKACYYDGATKVHVPKVHFGVNTLTTVYNAEIATLNPDSIELGGNRGIGVFVDTTQCKRFLIKRNCITGFGGRLGIVCYDTNGNILTNADSSYPHINSYSDMSFTYSATDYGGAYKTGSDTDIDYYFTVASNVAKIRILLLKGTANAKIKSFAIYTLDAKHAPVFSGYEEIVPGSNLGTVAPTTGTWSVGRKVFNATPTVGQPKSWICTVAGTPGTWVSEGNL